MFKLPSVPFYFVRHGQTDWNKQKIHMGQQDIPLNDYGQLQAELVYSCVKNESIRYIATSPLVRAYETALIINQKLNVPLKVFDDLKECSLGILEGQNYGNFELIEKWMQGKSPKGSESFIEFEMRVKRCITNILNFQSHTLIVSHGGFYAALCKIMKWSSCYLNNCDVIFHRPPQNSEPCFIYSL